MEETIEVVPSEETGNEPIEAPSEPVIEATPAPQEEPIIEQPALYELPDGRKVDAETLSREWKENFYPDYTRKSQALKAQEAQQQEPTAPTITDEWIPKSYAEIIQIAKQEAIADIESKEQAKIQQQQAVEANVANEIAEIKKTDPNVNVDAVFLHANKYGFNNLPSAHKNMVDMANMAKNVQQMTAQNVAKHNDPVSVSGGSSGGVKPDPSQFATATDYLRSLK